MKATPPTLAMQRVYEKLRTLPGTESVAASSAPPVNGVLLPNAVLHVDGRHTPTTDVRAQCCDYRLLSGDGKLLSHHENSDCPGTGFQ